MQSHLVFLRGKQFLQHTPPAIRLPPIWINPSDLPCDLACDLPCDLTCQCWQGTSASEHLFRKDSHVDDLYCAQCKGPILVDCQQTRELQLSYSSMFMPPTDDSPAKCKLENQQQAWLLSQQEQTSNSSTCKSKPAENLHAQKLHLDSFTGVNAVVPGHFGNVHHAIHLVLAATLCLHVKLHEAAKGPHIDHQTLHIHHSNT